jgi:hypothetical protein
VLAASTAFAQQDCHRFGKVKWSSQKFENPTFPLCNFPNLPNPNLAVKSGSNGQHHDHPLWHAHRHRGARRLPPHPQPQRSARAPLRKRRGQQRGAWLRGFTRYATMAVWRSCSGNVMQRIPMGANMHEATSHPQLNPPLLSACGQPSNASCDTLSSLDMLFCAASTHCPTFVIWCGARVLCRCIPYSVLVGFVSIHGTRTHAPPPLLASAHQPPLATRCLCWLPNTWFACVALFVAHRLLDDNVVSSGTNEALVGVDG